MILARSVFKYKLLRVWSVKEQEAIKLLAGDLY